MSTFYDYRLKTNDLPRALQAIAALRTAGLLGQSGGPENMLGDVIADAENRQVLRGRQGRAAITATDPDTGDTIVVPAIGDPARWYFAIRTTVPPEAVPIDPATYGLIPCDPAESRAVLGDWA
jgi:hypothetical protein